MAIGFDNARVKIHSMDGSECLRTKKNTFDVVITDSSDPIGKLLAQCHTLSVYYTAAAVTLVGWFVLDKVLQSPCLRRLTLRECLKL